MSTNDACGPPQPEAPDVDSGEDTGSNVKPATGMPDMTTSTTMHHESTDSGSHDD